MEKSILLNTVIVGAAIHRAGSTIEDDAVAASIAESGGVLWPATDLVVASAARLAVVMRAKGQGDRVDSLMQAAAAKSTSVIAVAGATTVIYQPGGIASGNIYTSDVEAAAALRGAIANGYARLEIDPTKQADPFDPVPWGRDNGPIVLDCESRLEISAAFLSAGSVGSSMLVADGSTFVSPRRIAEGAVVICQSRTTRGVILEEGAILELDFSGVVGPSSDALIPPVLIMSPGAAVIERFCNDGLDNSQNPSLQVVELDPSSPTNLYYFVFERPPFGSSYGNLIKGGADAQMIYGHDASGPKTLADLHAFFGTILGEQSVDVADGVQFDDSHGVPLLATATSAVLTVPALWDAVSIQVDDTTPIGVGDAVSVDGGGVYQVVSVDDATHVTAQLAPIGGPAPAPGTVVLSGAAVVVQTPTVQKAIDVLKTGAGGVPATRALTGADPVQIDGDSAPHDLSANRTISIVDAAPAQRGVVSAGPQTFAGTKTFADGIDLANQQAKNATAPTDPGDLTNKAYADSGDTASLEAAKAYADNIAAGLSPKASVTVIADTNVALAGLQTIDGRVLVDGESVLPVAQTTPGENIPWIVHAGAWTARGDTLADGAFTTVADGVVHEGETWILIDVGTFDWDQSRGATAVTAPLTLSAGVIGLPLATSLAAGAMVASDKVKIDAIPAPATIATQTYADSGDSATLASAEAYADSGDVSEANLRTQAAALTAALFVNGKRISNVADGAASSDVATFGQISGLGVPTKVAFSASALASLAAVQSIVPPGYGSATIPLGSRIGITASAFTQLRNFRVTFNGNALNAGKTVAFDLRVNGTIIATVTGPADNPSPLTFNALFGPAVMNDADTAQVIVTPSGVLAATVTDMMASAA